MAPSSDLPYSLLLSDAPHYGAPSRGGQKSPREAVQGHVTDLRR